MNVDSYTFTRRFGRAKWSYLFDNSVSKSKFSKSFTRMIEKCTKIKKYVYKENTFKGV